MTQNIKFLITFISATIFFAACSENKASIKKETWGQIENDTVYLYTISNSKGMTVKITNYGGIITSILTPDKNGNIDDVVLGFDNLKQYEEPHPSFGCIVGRVANWIENAEFKIDSTTYKLTKVLGGNDMLHGNNEFDRTVWSSEKVISEKGQGIKFHYLSKQRKLKIPLKKYVICFEDQLLSLDQEGFSNLELPCLLLFWALAEVIPIRNLENCYYERIEAFFEVYVRCCCSYFYYNNRSPFRTSQHYISRTTY